MSVNLFFFNDTATTEIYTLSLHDALPISRRLAAAVAVSIGLHALAAAAGAPIQLAPGVLANQFIVSPDGALVVFQSYLGDRKSTRLNSSHANISYAVFCLKKILICWRLYF